MGDVIHTLPALTDAAKAIPGIRFDWVVEEGFDEIPGWHPAVDKVITVALRRWRKRLISSLRGPEWKYFRQQMRLQHYDCIIDAQGLLKSAWICRYVKAPCFGLDRRSIREPLASLAYHHKVFVPKDMHAVERVRQLFAKALSYDLPEGKGDYGIDLSRFKHSGQQRKNLVFLHGTGSEAKCWPEEHWLALAEKATTEGYMVFLPWGNLTEKARAERIAARFDAAEVLPQLNLHGVASVLSRATGVVAVDSGLGRLTAALNVPAVSLFGPTDPHLGGAYGQRQQHVSVAVPEDKRIDAELKEIVPEYVWERFEGVLEPD